MQINDILGQYPKKVTLKENNTVIIRPLRAVDEKAFREFFQGVSDSVRTMYKYRVVDTKVIRSWCKHIDYGRILPLLAWKGNRIIADASLHQHLGGWRRHIGRVRLAMHIDYRSKELALAMLSELIDVARHMGLEKLEAELQDDHRLTRRALGELGFADIVVQHEYVKDMHAITHDYILMGRQLITDEEWTGAGD